MLNGDGCLFMMKLSKVSRILFVMLQCCYDVNLEVAIESDMSLSGLGASLLQEGQPVAFASRALTPTESCYAQIEKEPLSVVFACERFDTYLYG